MRSLKHLEMSEAELAAYENGTHSDYDYSENLWLNVGNEFGRIDEDSVAEYLNRHGYREV